MKLIRLIVIMIIIRPLITVITIVRTREVTMKLIMIMVIIIS